MSPRRTLSLALALAGLLVAAAGCEPYPPGRPAAEPAPPSSPARTPEPAPAPSTGERKTPCPQPNPEVICTAQYDPVICDGCRYSNSCVAGAAGFEASQCKPAPRE